MIDYALTERINAAYQNEKMASFCFDGLFGTVEHRRVEADWARR